MKDSVLFASLLVLIAAALWGLYRQRVHVNGALNEYSALKHVEESEVHLLAFQRAVHGGELNNPSSFAELRAALTAMSEYKAILSRYDAVLPPEITPDLQAQAGTMTRALVADLVQLTLQLDPAKAHRGPTPSPGTAFNPAELSPRIDRDSEQIARLLSLCNSFVRRTGEESVRDAHAAIVAVVTIAALMLAVALAGSFWEYRNVIVPLRYLRQWCRRTAAGDFSVRCTPAADGEFHDLGRDINQMADELNVLGA